MTWILLLHKTGALARGLTRTSTSFIIDKFDRSQSGSASNVMDAPPSVFRTQLLGGPANQAGPHIPGPASLAASAIPSHPDRCHLRTLVLIWQWLECLANDSINVCSNDILDSSPQLCHLTIPNKISVIKDFASQKQEEIHPLPAKNPEETSNPFPSC